MQEPIYEVPRHLLFAVQAHADRVAGMQRRLAEEIRAGAPGELIERVRDALRPASLEFQCAVLRAAAEGATSAELIGYGVPAGLAAELDRRLAP